MSDGTGLAEALLGLDGFRVLEVTETPAELVITVETTADLVSCSTYGTRAESQAGCRWRSGTCLLGAAGSAGVGQAPVAVPRAAVRGEDVDGALGSPRCAGGAVRRPLDGPPLGAPWERHGSGTAVSGGRPGVPADNRRAPSDRRKRRLTRHFTWSDSGGGAGNRTRVEGFAGPCLNHSATPPGRVTLAAGCLRASPPPPGQPEPRSSSTRRSQPRGALTGLQRAAPSPGRSATYPVPNRRSGTS